MNFSNIEASMISIGRNPNIITQAIVLAYTGWGYNFYSTANKLRADDLLIRAKIANLLSRTATDLSALGAKLAASVPEPSRQAPRPGAEIMPIVNELRRLASAASNLSVKMAALSTPGRDKIWDRHRTQNETLIKLQGFDLYLGQLAFDLQALVEHKTADDLQDKLLPQTIEGFLDGLSSALREREDMLSLGG
jgi:hypothetical protein